MGYLKAKILKMSKPPAKVNYFPSDIDLKEGDLFSSHLLTLQEWQPIYGLWEFLQSCHSGRRA